MTAADAHMSAADGAYEYAVMHSSHPQEPHRRPFRRGEDGSDYFDLTPHQQREWCRQWVQDCINSGMKAGAFYVVRRRVTAWEASSD